MKLSFHTKKLKSQIYTFHQSLLIYASLKALSLQSQLTSTKERIHLRNILTLQNSQNKLKLMNPKLIQPHSNIHQIIIKLYLICLEGPPEFEELPQNSRILYVSMLICFPSSSPYPLNSIMSYENLCLPHKVFTTSITSQIEPKMY